MVDVKSLNPGDVVKIVDQWPGYVGQASGHDMDKWLGKTMTVLRHCGTAFFGENVGTVPFVEMEEDVGEFVEGGWSWNGHMIDYVVQRACEPEQPAEPIEDKDFGLLFS